ncbi:hypothetical protein SLINC_1834 [Streptomyces lincolnensis]|uniref:Uncharacterized protein n=1 Tax=Streptomyces lincolnensis TaxID=1915 RepID=A0A1B1M5X6_STRLN|nr:DUF742 domain-containing protein [Streptomyces lincolnensis]ANS64058.1 hypothetical protein SLINC_1834 [Streptomyces lincolnensis]AXG57732.1 hypothetical protein SLCG_6577 [Streptomyces lincolnensis]QMV05898.1 DUF742 domain-containing protein [Streptomyces lincolnensis]
MTPPQRRRRYPKAPEPAPQPPQEGQNPPEGPKKNPERLYVITGPDGTERSELDLVTLIVAHADPPPSATPEQAALLRLCTAPLSVAELSAYLSLPFSVVTVLLTELLTAELVTARAPVIRQALADRSLLEAVMHGLQKL